VISDVQIFTYFVVISTIGFYAAYLYGRKTKRFLWREYIALLSVPVITSFGLTYFYGIKIVYLFFTSAIIGFILEYFLGLTYHKTLNKRLWKYEKYNFQGYTSYLTPPMWGIAGIVFWLLAKSIGL